MSPLSKTLILTTAMLGSVYGQAITFEAYSDTACATLIGSWTVNPDNCATSPFGPNLGWSSTIIKGTGGDPKQSLLTVYSPNSCAGQSSMLGSAKTNDSGCIDFGFVANAARAFGG